MGFLSWIQGVLFSTPATATVEPSAPPAKRRQERPKAPADAPMPKPAEAKASAGSLLRPRVGPLDGEENVAATLASFEADLLARLVARIESGQLDVPQLPSTSMAALELANRPSVEMRQLVEVIERDPLVTSELLRTANSALYATKAEAASLQQAVMRVGLRSVRNVVFGAAMKGSLGASKRLNEYAEEVWRQAQAVAVVARALGERAGLDRDQAYLIGLLHDLGKIALLGMLQREMRDLGRLTPALVGRTFHSFHERAGRVMAEAWKLPPEITSIAGCHHDFAANTSHAREAALAKLAHEVDLRLSLHDESGLRAMVESPALEQLGIRDEAARWQAIETAREAWEAHAAGNDAGG